MRNEEKGDVAEDWGEGQPSFYTIHNFNLHYMTGEWRLIKHDNRQGVYC